MFLNRIATAFKGITTACFQGDWNGMLSRRVAITRFQMESELHGFKWGCNCMFSWRVTIVCFNGWWGGGAQMQFFKWGHRCMLSKGVAELFSANCDGMSFSKKKSDHFNPTIISYKLSFYKLQNSLIIHEYFLWINSWTFSKHYG